VVALGLGTTITPAVTTPAAAETQAVGTTAPDTVALSLRKDGVFAVRDEAGKTVETAWGDSGRKDVYAVAGDWDGDSIDTLGYYRQEDGSFHLRDEEGAQLSYAWGDNHRKDVAPVAGDWDGDGKDTVGYFRQADATFHLSNEEGGTVEFRFGDPGIRHVYPVAGDWDGDGKDTVGTFRRSDSSFHLTTEEGTQVDYAWGDAAEVKAFPIAGDWDNDGRDTIGLYKRDDASVQLSDEEGGQSSFAFGDDDRRDTLPVAGDWNGLSAEEKAAIEAQKAAEAKAKADAEAAAAAAAAEKARREIPTVWSTADCAGVGRTTGPETVTTAPGTSIQVHSCLADAVSALVAHAARDGLTIGGRGWRSAEEQIRLRAAHCGSSNYAIYQAPPGACSPPTARPGTSNHEGGVAIDFSCNGGNIGNSGNSPCFHWLRQHAAQYGLYNLPSENWHWSTDGR
jgi:LAS superfamily LD-carboxypeptidase LdcB